MATLASFLGEHAKSIETMVYKQVNGVDIKADVYLPKQSLPGLPPCVYYLHGGGFIIGDRATVYPFQMVETLDRGWAVVSLDYRLSPNAAMKDIYEDVADGYSWIRRELNTKVDINRIAVWGHSAGGTLAEAAGYILYPRPKVLVSFYGISDFTLNYNADPSQPAPECSELAKKIRAGQTVSQGDFDHDLSDIRDRSEIKARSKDPAVVLFQDVFQTWKTAEIVMQSKDINIIRRYSPVNNLGMDYPPIYLAHGDNDQFVPSKNSEEFAEAAKGKSIPYELKIVLGGLHGFDTMAMSNGTDEIWAKFVAPAFDFVEKYL